MGHYNAQYRRFVNSNADQNSSFGPGGRPRRGLAGRFRTLAPVARPTRSSSPWPGESDGTVRNIIRRDRAGPRRGGRTRTPGRQSSAVCRRRDRGPRADYSIPSQAPTPLRRSSPVACQTRGRTVIPAGRGRNSRPWRRRGRRSGAVPHGRGVGEDGGHQRHRLVRTAVEAPAPQLHPMNLSPVEVRHRPAGRTRLLEEPPSHRPGLLARRVERLLAVVPCRPLVGLLGPLFGMSADPGVADSDCTPRIPSSVTRRAFSSPRSPGRPAARRTCRGTHR